MVATKITERVFNQRLREIRIALLKKDRLEAERLARETKKQFEGGYLCFRLGKLLDRFLANAIYKIETSKDNPDLNRLEELIGLYQSVLSSNENDSHSHFELGVVYITKELELAKRGDLSLELQMELESNAKSHLESARRYNRSYSSPVKSCLEKLEKIKIIYMGNQLPIGFSNN